MMTGRIHILHTGVRTATLELENEEAFFSGRELTVYLDGKPAMKTDRNIFTLFGLMPETDYSIYAECPEDGSKSEHISFTTAEESMLIDVREYGALGDGIKDDTAFIQAAIASAPKHSTVWLGHGTFRTGPLFLKSDINLWIDKDARLLGIESRERYPVLPGMQRMNREECEYNLGSWEGNPLSCFASLITAIDADNIGIFGEGVIDGNAMNSDWWEDAKVKRGSWRPRTVFLCRCRNVYMTGLNVRNSPSWTIHPYYCDKLSFLDMTVENPEDAPNTDGIDPESCTEVLIAGLSISVGDDCVAVKSGKYYMADKHFKRTEHVEIRNCYFASGHGAITVGSEVSCGVTGVKARQCIFDGTDRGVRIKTRRGRGERSVIDDILVENVKMHGVRLPVTINMHYCADPDGHTGYVQRRESMPVDAFTPRIGRIRLERISCDGTGAAFLCALGLKESPIGRIEIEDVNGIYDKDAEPQCPIMADDFPALRGVSVYAENVECILLKRISLTDCTEKEPVLINVGEQSSADIECITSERTDASTPNNN